MTDEPDRSHLASIADSLRRIADTLERADRIETMRITAEMCPTCHGQRMPALRQTCYFHDCPNIVR